MEEPIDPIPAFYIRKLEVAHSSDGRDWQILRWVSRDVLLRLRMAHTSLYDPTDFIAEIKVFDIEDPRRGRGEYGFAMVGKFSVGIAGVAEQAREVENNPEERPCDHYPTIYGDEFAQLAVLLGKLLEDQHYLGNIRPT